MKTGEVLAVLEISKPTLYSLMDEGRIKPLPKNPLLKRARRLYFRKEEVMALKAQIEAEQTND